MVTGTRGETNPFFPVTQQWLQFQLMTERHECDTQFSIPVSKICWDFLEPYILAIAEAADCARLVRNRLDKRTLQVPL